MPRNNHPVSKEQKLPPQDRDLLEDLVKALVERPEEVEVKESVDTQTGTSHFVIYANRDDRGKIIGKNGRTVDAIRLIFMSIASLESRKVFIEVYEPRRANNNYYR